jgi:hypothetical protein
MPAARTTCRLLLESTDGLGRLHDQSFLALHDDNERADDCEHAEP